MNKKIALALTLAASLTALSTSAFAAEPTTAAPTTTAAKEKTVDPQKQEVKSMFATLQDLRQQHQAIRDNLQAQTDLNRHLLDSIKGQVLSNDAVQKVQASKEELKGLHEQADHLQADLKAQEEALKAAKEAGDDAQVDALKQKIESDRDALTLVKNQVEALKADAELQAAIDQVKTGRADLKTDLEKVRQLWTKEKGQWAEVKSLQAAKEQQWTVFHEAMKNKDFAAAKTAMQQILSLKTMIIDKDKQILGTKQDIGTLLATVKDGLGGSAPAPTPQQ